MNIDAVGAFLIVFLNILFWLLTMSKRDVGEHAHAFFWWSFFVTLWAFGYGITLSGYFTEEVTLSWNKWCQAMALLVGPLFFRLSASVVNQTEKYKKTFLIYLCFSIPNAGALFFTPYYVKGLWSFGEYVYQPLAGPLYSLFFGSFVWFTIHGFWLVIRHYPNLYTLQKKQAALFLWATGIAYFGSLTLFLPVYGIAFPSTGVYLILAYVFILGYSVDKYKFFDIDFLIATFRREKLATMELISASVNHEVKNPLYIIKSHAETFLEKANENVFQNEAEALMKAEEVFKKTVEQTDRAIDIMNRFSFFAKEGGHEKPQKESLSFKDVLKSIRPFLNYELATENIAFRMEIPADLPPIQADKRHIEEALFNLMRNACQAMKEGGEIEVSARVRNEHVEVVVKDNGPGIPKDKLAQIFEPFCSSRSDGTGLGLYITKQLIERNKGKISVESIVGQGTQFKLEFKIGRI